MSTCRAATDPTLVTVSSNGTLVPTRASRGAVFTTVMRVGPPGGGGRRRWLLAAADVLAWHRASRLPRSIPADPVRQALDGSLRLALDRDLALRAFERLEAERRRLGSERLAVQEARRGILPG